MYCAQLRAVAAIGSMAEGAKRPGASLPFPTGGSKPFRRCCGSGIGPMPATVCLYGLTGFSGGSGGDGGLRAEVRMADMGGAAAARVFFSARYSAMAERTEL